MLRRNYLLASLLLMALVAWGALPALAAPVGQFLQVEGQVDLLKAEKLPALPVKVQDAVHVGDVVRTKSESRAQIKFVDDTVLTIAPESRVTVEEYMFDGAKGERKAVLGVLRGLVHTAVEKVYPREEPDFLMKTHTAVLGVRGTKWYTKLLPNATDIYTEGTLLEVRSTLPGVPGVVLMKSLQYVRAGAFLSQPVAITPEDLKPLEKMMKFGLGPVSWPTDPCLPIFGPPRIYAFLGMRPMVENIYSGFYVPPLQEARHYFLIIWSGSWDEYFDEGFGNRVFVSSYGFGQNSPFFANEFASEFMGSFNPPASYDPLYGSFTARATGWYKVGPGGRLVGTIQVVFTPTPYYYTGLSYGSYRLAALTPRPLTAEATNSSGSLYRATLSGPFVFNPQQQILRAPVSGPYLQPGGQRYQLRGILIQTPGGEK